jgi:hypothetical protein
MFPISFLTLLLVAMSFHSKEIFSAPTPDNDNLLTDHTLFKIDSSSDPVFIIIVLFYSKDLQK